LDEADRIAIRIEVHHRAYDADRDRDTIKENKYRKERYDDHRVRQVEKARETSHIAA